MTSKEIAENWESIKCVDETVAPFYLKEIAYQLAVMNERRELQITCSPTLKELLLSESQKGQK